MFSFISLLTCHLKPRVPLLSPVGSPSHISACNSQEEQNNLDKKPSPATAATFLLGSLDMALIFGGAGRSTAGSGGASNAVQVLGLERDDVVVVAQFTGFGGETQVRDGRDGNVGFLCV